MSNIQFSIVSSGDDEFLTAFIPGEPTPFVATKSGNPHFDKIERLLRSGDADASICDLFTLSKAVAERFESLSDRVIVEGGNVLFDGAVVDNSLTKQIVRFLDEGSDFSPLVAFMNNVMDNPEPHSREQLYDWLSQRDFTITWDGHFVGYKGVDRDGDSFRSISSGKEPVFVEEVDGTTTKHTGRIPNPVGGMISMDRGLVQHDPSVGCHVGLHVGTFEYAKSFSNGAVLEVHVNPRDVVSVPTDCDWAKIRTCRYTVVNVIDQPYSTGLVDPDGDWDEDFQQEWDDFDLD